MAYERFDTTGYSSTTSRQRASLVALFIYSGNIQECSATLYGTAADATAICTRKRTRISKQCVDYALRLQVPAHTCGAPILSYDLNYTDVRAMRYAFWAYSSKQPKRHFPSADMIYDCCTIRDVHFDVPQFITATRRRSRTRIVI